VLANSLGLVGLVTLVGSLTLADDIKGKMTSTEIEIDPHRC